MRINQQKYYAHEVAFLFRCVMVKPQLKFGYLKAQGGCGLIKEF